MGKILNAFAVMNATIMRRARSRLIESQPYYELSALMSASGSRAGDIRRLSNVSNISDNSNGSRKNSLSAAASSGAEPLSFYSSICGWLSSFLLLWLTLFNGSRAYLYSRTSSQSQIFPSNSSRDIVDSESSQAGKEAKPSQELTDTQRIRRPSAFGRAPGLKSNLQPSNYVADRLAKQRLRANTALTTVNRPGSAEGSSAPATPAQRAPPLSVESQNDTSQGSNRVRVSVYIGTSSRSSPIEYHRGQVTKRQIW